MSRDEVFHDRGFALTVACGWTVLVSVGLALWLILGSRGDLGSLALPLLLSPCVVAILAYYQPTLATLILADIVLAVVLVLLLIGFTGLLYVPALVLMIAATPSARRLHGVPGSESERPLQA
jgi:hypothetical protein